jgi:hypothetical protein
MLSRFTKRKIYNGQEYVWDSILYKWVLLSVLLNHDSFSKHDEDDFSHIRYVDDDVNFNPGNIITEHDDFADAFQGGASGGGGATGSWEVSEPSTPSVEVESSSFESSSCESSCDSGCSCGGGDD